MVLAGAEVTLDGSKSLDADGGILSYRWRQLAGPPVTLSNPVEVHPRFMAPPSKGERRELVFQLLVTNAAGLQDKARVVVEVREALQ